MDINIEAREYGCIDSSDTNYSKDMSAEEMEPDLLSSDDEIPFARHGPIIRPNQDDVVAQRDFWNRCAIGFLLDCREFSVSYFQNIINAAWRLRGPVTVVGRESYFYILHFEYIEDLQHICNEGPWALEGALLVLEKWRPNLVLNRLQLNYISIWVQFHGLSLEYQYPELAKYMGQLMGIVEQVDWEDRIPRNISFMRVKVRVDPWLPVITSFSLRTDEGSNFWIQCRYERVHKLCTRCGLIGHTQRQCTHCIDDIKRSLYRQKVRIQDLHQVQFRFDALEPQFSNELRAFHRRRWTTQIKFGHLTQTLGHATPFDPFPEYFDPSTPSPPHSPQEPRLDNTKLPESHNQTPNFNLQATSNCQPNNNESILNTAINLLNLNNRTIPPTLANSLVSNTSIPTNPETVNQENDQVAYQHMQQDHTSNMVARNNLSTRPPWAPPENSNMTWAWIEGNDPVITNGQSQYQDFEESEIENDTTAVLFNLDSLNEERHEIVQSRPWMNGYIPESPDSFIESLVQRVNHGRFRFELGSSITGPSLLPTQTEEAQSKNVNPTSTKDQELDQCVAATDPSPHANLSSSSPAWYTEGRVRDLSPFVLLTLGPSLPFPTTSESTPFASPTLTITGHPKLVLEEDNLSENSRKRLKKVIEKIGRSIGKMLCCGLFDKESHQSVVINPQKLLSTTNTTTTNAELEDVLWEVSPQQLPRQP